MIQKLKGLDLAKKKLKDFKIVVAIQLALVFSSLVLYWFLQLFKIENALIISESVFFACIGIYVWALWDLIRNFTQSNALIIGLFIIIMGVFLLGLVTVNPFITIFEGDTYLNLVLFVMVALFTVEIFVIYFTMGEMFKRDLPTEEKFWGAACIYLLIGITFGGVYEIVCILDPQSIPMNVPFTSIHLMKSIAFSFSIMGGVESHYNHVTELVFNITTIESVWANTFIVFVVGRLFYK